jgi:hypothetical protein
MNALDTELGSCQLGGAVLHYQDLGITDAYVAKVKCCHSLFKVFSFLGEAQDQDAYILQAIFYCQIQFMSRMHQYYLNFLKCRIMSFYFAVASPFLLSEFAKSPNFLKQHRFTLMVIWSICHVAHFKGSLDLK